MPSALGTRVPTSAFRDHVFGVVLVNDWSARDIQAWEYVPLGPFLGKSFATSISPWVVPLDALEHARVAPPRQHPAPLPYLHEDQPWGLDLALEVEWNGDVVARPPFGQMYWTAAQQLAHMTVNGAALRTGDLYASGTVSGPEREQRGSFLELSWNGAEPGEALGRLPTDVPGGGRHGHHPGYPARCGRGADRVRRCHRHHRPGSVRQRMDKVCVERGRGGRRHW